MAKYAASSVVTLKEGWQKSAAIGDSFKKHFFRYMLIREGCVLEVYADHKGYPTVGIGHLVVPADKLKIGDMISFDKAVSFFNYDYTRLKIQYLVDRAAWWGVPQKLAVASFVWCHGYGEYLGGTTEKMLMNKATDSQSCYDYVRLNWDKNSVPNQLRNKYDLDLFFRSYTLSPAGNFYWNGDSHYIKPISGASASIAVSGKFPTWALAVAAFLILR